MLTRALHPSNAKLAELYEHDLSAWATQNAQLLRQSQFDRIDIHNLAEELQDMGRSERRALESFVQNVLMHLLKWQYQPQRRSDSWLDSITDARTQIELAIADSPSLKSYPAVQLKESYSRARRQAAKQTGIQASAFPEECPYAIELVLDEDWLP